MSRFRSLAAAAALLFVFAHHPVIAAERLGRLTVDVKVTGNETWRNAQGTDHATVRFAQTLSYSTVVKTDGEVLDFNIKDPNYAQQQMAQGVLVAQAVTSAQGKAPMTQAEFQDRVNKGQAACKGDQQCLMELSLKASEWSMQLLAGQPTTAPAQQGSGSYVNYYGFENCGAKIHITVNDVAEGATADVQGPLPFKVKKTADYTGDVNERALLCATQLVVDPRQKMIYTDGITIGWPKGTSVRTKGSRPSEEWQGEIPLKGEAFKWASEQLRRAPLSGTRKGTVKITDTSGSSVPFAATQGGGTAEVELSWRFEELR